jgi:hypothetical protein
MSVSAASVAITRSVIYTFSPFVLIKYAMAYLRPDFYRACSINSSEKSVASAGGFNFI